MIQARLRQRTVSRLSRSYLVYRSLWPAILAPLRVILANAQRELSVLDVGCGEKPYEDCFEGHFYVGLNYGMEAADPDVVADAMRMPFSSGVFDVVFSTQVIEHVRRPWVMLAECHRVLRSGGTLLISGPFYWPLHEEPHDYFRFTEYGFRALLEDSGFHVEEICADVGAITQAAISMIEVLPRWMSPLIPLMNLVVPILEGGGKSPKSTLNYICVARKV